VDVFLRFVEVEPALVDPFGDVGERLLICWNSSRVISFCSESIGRGRCCRRCRICRAGVHGDGFDKVDRQSVLRPFDAGLPAFFKFCPWFVDPVGLRLSGVRKPAFGELFQSAAVGGFGGKFLSALGSPGIVDDQFALYSIKSISEVLTSTPSRMRCCCSGGSEELAMCLSSGDGSENGIERAGLPVDESRERTT